MAKHTTRFGLPVLFLTALAALILVPFARSDAPQDAPAVTPEQAQIAMSLRESIGFGPRDLLPAMSSNQQHGQMITAGLVFAVNSDADLQPILDAHQQAEKQLVHALTWKASQEQVEEAYQQVQQSRQALIQSVAQVTPQLQNILDQSDAPLVGMVMQNIDLDPELRTIALGEDQRTSEQRFARPCGRCRPFCSRLSHYVV